MRRIAALALVALTAASAGCGSSKAGPHAVNASVARDVAAVNATVTDVLATLGLYLKSPTTANLDQLVTTAQQAHDSLTNMKDQVATDVPLNNAGGDLTNAVNEMKNSMGALVAVSGTPNAATVASFNSEYKRAVVDWNSAVGEIYAGASSGAAPTLPSAF